MIPVVYRIQVDIMKYKTVPVVHLEGLHKSDVHQDAPVITVYAPMI
jgi:hypothetical protein